MITNNIFDAAIEAHLLWKLELKKKLESGSVVDSNLISNNQACDLGKWIYKDGIRYNRLPSFESMCVAHEQFHRFAAEVVFHHNEGHKIKAKSLFTDDGEFSRSSTKLIKALMDCSKDLADTEDAGIIKNKQKVKDILQTKKNNKIFSIEGHVPTLDAIKTMVDHNIGSLVVNQRGEFLGIFTERGYLKQLLSKGCHSLDEPVSEMIDANIISVNPNDSVYQCMILMTTTHTRHLPVIDVEKLVGMVSIGDIIGNVVSDDNDKISQLEAYIHNDYGAQI